MNRLRAKVRFEPVHPGEILLQEFMKPHKLSQARLAADTHVPTKRISELVRRKRGISANTALRLGRYFGVSPQFWMNLQAHYDLARAEDKLGERLQREVRRLA